MKIRYTPFSERMVIDQPVKGMDFANNMIQTYFMMSLRYRECYYKQRPQGNTVYFMNYPEASLLFYFAAGMRSYRVNGFRIEKEERRKAWIYMLPLIQSLRAYDFGRKEGTKQLSGSYAGYGRGPVRSIGAISFHSFLFTEGMFSCLSGGPTF